MNSLVLMAGHQRFSRNLAQNSSLKDLREAIRKSELLKDPEGVGDLLKAAIRIRIEEFASSLEIEEDMRYRGR
jgi:hypothetical protein